RSVVVARAIAEQREGFRKRTPSQNDVGATVGKRVNGREPLENPYRIIGRQNRNGRSKLDAPCPGCDAGQHHLWSRDGEIRSMMLANANEIHADLVGKDGLFKHVANNLRLVQQLSVGVHGDVAEGVYPEFVGFGHGPSPRAVRPGRSCVMPLLQAAAGGVVPRLGKSAACCVQTERTGRTVQDRLTIGIGWRLECPRVNGRKRLFSASCNHPIIPPPPGASIPATGKGPGPVRPPACWASGLSASTR